MTAPVTPVAQALAWSGGDLPDAAAQPVAAIGNGLLLAYDGSVLSLWRLVGIPQRIAALVVGESLSTFRHTSGTVRCIASSGGVDRLAAIGIGGSGITYSLGSSALPPTIVEMIVAEGGQETVISTSDSIIGYTAAGTWSWECARPDAADPNMSGKLVGAPRAGRWLWVNTTSESRVENHTGVLGTPSGDATSGYTWSVTFPTLDVTGETVDREADTQVADAQDIHVLVDTSRKPHGSAAFPTSLDVESGGLPIAFGVCAGSGGHCPMRMTSLQRGPRRKSS